LTCWLKSTTSANYKASIRTQNTKQYKYIRKKRNVQNETKSTYNNTYKNNNINEVLGRNASILKILISLFLNVKNQYRICFKEVIVIIIKQGQLNHGAGSANGRDKNILRNCS
jgi:hypothetical protein